MTRWSLLGCCAVLASGCATVPDVKYTYYAVGWKGKASVTQTVGCDAKQLKMVILSTATVTPSYFADTSKTYEVRANSLNGALADSEFTIVFTQDGRLKSLNQSTTGRAEEVVTSVITFVGAVAGAVALGNVDPRPPSDPIPRACKEIAEWDEGKPVTFEYEADFGPSQVGDRASFRATGPNAVLYDRIASALPFLSATVTASGRYEAGARFRIASDSKDYAGVLLKMQEVDRIAVTVTSTDAKTEVTLLDTSIHLVPSSTTYDLPIPKPPLFGQQRFELDVADSGAITSISYAKLDGTASGLSAAGSIAGAQTSVSTAKAAALNARSELIAAQQKAVTCKAKPEQCGK